MVNGHWPADTGHGVVDTGAGGHLAPMNIELVVKLCGLLDLYRGKSERKCWGQNMWGCQLRKENYMASV